MGLSVAVLPGDGVGPEVTSEVLNVLQGVGERSGHSFNLNEGLVGGVATDTLSKALSYEALCVIVGYAKPGLKRRIMLNVRRLNRRGE
jgi:3-isopropylmalate dehydrogenase